MKKEDIAKLDHFKNTLGENYFTRLFSTELNEDNKFQKKITVLDNDNEELKVFQLLSNRPIYALREKDEVFYKLMINKKTRNYILVEVKAKANKNKIQFAQEMKYTVLDWNYELNENDMFKDSNYEDFKKVTKGFIRFMQRNKDNCLTEEGKEIRNKLYQEKINIEKELEKLKTTHKEQNIEEKYKFELL